MVFAGNGGFGMVVPFTSAIAASVCQGLAYNEIGKTHVVLGISMVASPLPNSNSLKQLKITLMAPFLRVLQQLFRTLGNLDVAVA